MQDAIAPTARLLRGFAVDFLTAHQPEAARRIMDPHYCLSIGGFSLAGRDDAYLPATVAQLEQFPGLCVTVHDTIIGENGMAMRFTEHGVSVRNPGVAAAWGGITLFRVEQGRMRLGWAEEDYFARKRQLRAGACDAVLPPASAPWDQPALPASAETEARVRAWLADAAWLFTDPVVETICAEGPGFASLVVPERIEIDALFTSGLRAAFHLVCHGRYAGGFPDIDAAHTGHEVSLAMAGIADVDAAGTVTRVQLSADRLGLHRSLLDLSRG